MLLTESKWEGGKEHTILSKVVILELFDIYRPKKDDEVEKTTIEKQFPQLE